jgi:hypothetical protein
MVILATTSSRAKECAAAIERTTHQKTQIATSLARAVECLQTHDYDVLVLDESFNHAEIGRVNMLLNHAGLAMPIYVNLGLHGTEPVTREVQNGMLRLVREKPAAMRSAENVLRGLLRGEVTANLLNSELALREPSLSEKTSPEKSKSCTTSPRGCATSWKARPQRRLENTPTCRLPQPTNRGCERTSIV